MLRTLFLLALGALVGSAALLGFMAWRISAQGERDEQRPADAIVVLGAAQFNGIPGGVFAARLDHAVGLWKAGIAPYLIVTGGKLPADRTTEAATARAWAIAHGVPARAILDEDQGRSTLESLEGVERIFRDRGFRTGVFVSDRTHMLRVLRMARDLGMEAWGSPTATSPTDLEPARRSKAILHELAGLLAYYVGLARQLPDVSGAASP